MLKGQVFYPTRSSLHREFHLWTCRDRCTIHPSSQASTAELVSKRLRLGRHNLRSGRVGSEISQSWSHSNFIDVSSRLNLLGPPVCYWQSYRLGTSVFDRQHLQNECKRLHNFVANRPGTTQEVTTASHWRHVQSSKNPADDASRGVSVEDLLDNRGPDFLWRQESTAEVYSQSTEINEEAMNKVVKRFSSWHGLKKFIIWILCFRDTLQSTVVQNGVVTQPSPRKRRYSKLPLTSYEMEKKRLQNTLKKKVSEEEFSIINILGGTNSKR